MCQLIKLVKDKRIITLAKWRETCEFCQVWFSRHQYGVRTTPTIRSHKNKAIMANNTTTTQVTGDLDLSDWDDATWILTSSFIIFTMQSGNSFYLLYTLLRFVDNDTDLK